MDIRCFHCGRPLSNHLSIQRGIGPICFARQEQLLDAEEQQRQRNLKCHHGFVCYAPAHTAVTLERFWRRFGAMADQTDLPNEIRQRASELVEQASDALGLDRERVIVPEVDIPMFGRETIAALNLPAHQEPGGVVSYSMPVDHDDQYRRMKLRELQVCPFGLDCRDPGQAVTAVWSLLSLMRYQVEPHLLTEENCGWAWDSLLYQALVNTLQLLGLDDEGQAIQDVVEQQRRNPKSLRLSFKAILA